MDKKISLQKIIKDTINLEEESDMRRYQMSAKTKSGVMLL